MPPCRSLLSRSRRFDEMQRASVTGRKWSHSNPFPLQSRRKVAERVRNRGAKASASHNEVPPNRRRDLITLQHHTNPEHRARTKDGTVKVHAVRVSTQSRHVEGRGRVRSADASMSW